MASPEKFNRRQFLRLAVAGGVLAGMGGGLTAAILGRNSKADMPQPQDVAAASGPTPEPKIAATPRPTEVPATATVRPTNTAEPTASATPTGTATKEPTATPTLTPTKTPEKPTSTPTEIPTQVPPTKTPEPTKIPTPKPTPVPTAIPTSAPVEQPTVPPTPKPEATSAAFPKEIGNLERDGVMIHNMGTRIGVIDNREDPQNNWQAVVNVFRQYAQGTKVEFFFYDNPNDVPQPETLQTPYKYDPTLYWERVGVPGVSNGRTIAGQTAEGVWQAHSSLPFIKPEDQNQLNSKINRSLNRGIVVQILTYSFRKNDLFAKQPPEFSAILRQQAIPASSDKTNFSLKVVYK